MKISFGTALNCIDGRAQLPVINWMKENFDVDYVDLITEPGMDKVLSQGNKEEIKRIKEKTEISVNVHDSAVVAVVGHYDCAGNPVSFQKHYSDIVAATFVVESWSLPVKVVGLWVDDLGCVQVIKI